VLPSLAARRGGVILAAHAESALERLIDQIGREVTALAWAQRFGPGGPTLVMPVPETRVRKQGLEGRRRQESQRVVLNLKT
jgi:hypothetical protein